MEGVITPNIVTVGHIPMEISRLCHYFLLEGGTIEGQLVDTKPRRSPIPSAGLEVKLTLKCSTVGNQARGPYRQDGVGVREYGWDYTGEGRPIDHPDPEDMETDTSEEEAEEENQ